jgi:sulfhydrogenase subunit beta (sulfur reductase)
MSAWRKLAAADVPAFLAELSDRYEVVVPQSIDGKVRFAGLEAGKAPVFPASVVDVSAKALFFPKRRAIARYDAKAGAGLLPVESPTRARVIVGVHPCDVAAVTYSDRVFLDSGHKDALYEAERKRTTIVGLACSEMGPECHCTDRGLSPDSEAGMDAVMVPTKDGLLVRALTDKGTAALKSSRLADTNEQPVKRDWPKGRRPIAAATELQKLYEDEFWTDVAELCLTCGACTFACPTCTCFLVADEKHDGAGERVTCWDSCQFQGYARMTGGHNPRKTRAARVRNRMLDKLAYTEEKYGAMSCVGCGRCARVCPVGRHFPREAAELSAKARKAGA